MLKYYTPSWITLGTSSGKLYGMVFKGANKSTIWYSVSAFKNAGVKPPATWTQLLADAKTLRASGTPAFSIDGGDGWPLTDIFENVYIRTAGASKYDLLAAHHLKWTDPSVKVALKTMAQIFGDTGNIYGGTSGALQALLADSVNDVFSTPPKAAMTIEGDFVPTAATVKAKPLTGYNVFPFPVDPRLAALRRRWRRHRRDVQGHAGGTRAHHRTSPRPRRPRSGPSWADSPRPTRACRRAPIRTS